MFALLLLGGLFLQAQAVRAAPPSAPLLGFTPTSTPAPTNTPFHTESTPTPQIGKADPAITKRGDPSSAYPGEEVTFTIEVTNNGQYAAVDVVVTDEVSEYFDILEVTTTQGTVTVDGQVVTVQVGIVGPGFVVEIVIQTRLQQDAPAPLRLENVAVLNSPNGGNDSSPPVTITIPDPLLPVTGQQALSWLGWVPLGLGLLAIGLWYAIRKEARHNRLG
ncbi:MAG: DUF11 domain-containing protein [Anaerolineae bacterium]|nr:DUF11 domain-containing protein [Anaerolineae bacterium]